MTDELYQKRAHAWFEVQKAAGKPLGVMLRPTDVERWNAWKAYFRAKDPTSELKGMGLCERDQWPSREPGTNLCWRMFPADWPHEFDPKGAADARA
jgi:hypothetical protein